MKVTECSERSEECAEDIGHFDTFFAHTLQKNTQSPMEREVD